MLSEFFCAFLIKGAIEMEKKKPYTKPEATLVCFSTEDVLGVFSDVNELVDPGQGETPIIIF